LTYSRGVGLYTGKYLPPEKWISPTDIRRTNNTERKKGEISMK
jgi:hypothetical protein